MKRLLTALGWLLILPGFAQLPVVTYPDTLRNRLILKIAPLAALDPDGTYEGALEFLPNPRWSIQQGFGYGNSTILPVYQNSNFNDEGWRQVWRMRTEVRWYRHGGYAIGRLRNPYWAVEFLAKRVQVNQQGNVRRECANGDCAYFQRMTYRHIREVYALHFKGGWQESFGRWQLDFHYGFGVRQIDIYTQGLPEDAVAPTPSGFQAGFRETPVMLPSLSAGIKVGWLLGKLPAATSNQ